MSGGLSAVLARRARLVERASEQREEVAEILQVWERPLGMVDRGLGFVRGLRKHGRVIGAGLSVALAVVGIARPRKLQTGLHRGLTAWRIVNRLAGLAGLW